MFSASKRILNDAQGILQAIKITRNGIRKGGGPFGAIITGPEGDILSEAYATVQKKTDPTAHAEILAIRQATRKCKTLTLEKCTIYCTTEPCLMCMGAIVWARLDKIVFSSLISDSQNIGFSEQAEATANNVKKLLDISLKIKGPILRQEGLSIFYEWQELGYSAYY